MRQAAQLVSLTLSTIAHMVRPGVTTQEIDEVACDFIHDNGAVPSFLGYNGFPKSLCISVNEQVVHGIPNKRPLEEGDLVSIDCGVYLNGYHGDHAYSFVAGQPSPDVAQLMRVTKECLYQGIEQTISGKRVGDISHAIQQHATKHNYGVVRELTGHGLGRSLHEDPAVPNYGKRGHGPLLRDGLVIAIEPMINMGKKEVYQLKDGWTIVTRDGKPSAHYEHDVAIVDGKPMILSNFEIIEQTLDQLGAFRV